MAAATLRVKPDTGGGREWTRSDTLGLGKASCKLCAGLGLRLVHKQKYVPCHCVFRAVFRACYNRYRECSSKSGHIGTVSLEYTGGKDGKRAYSRKREEFLADFWLVSLRTLDEAEFRIFRFYFLLGADWKYCCARLGMDRGNFFHAVYRIQQKLGRTFAELEPYGLWPLDEYFGGVVGGPLPLAHDVEGRSARVTPRSLTAMTLGRGVMFGGGRSL